MTIIASIYMLFAGLLLHLASKNYGNSQAILQRSKDNLRDSDELKAQWAKEVEDAKASGKALIEKMAKSLVSAEVHAAGGCDCEDEDSHKETN